MRITRRKLNTLIDNYLFEQAAKQSSKDIESDDEYEYKRSTSSKYGWTFRKKNADGKGVGSFKPINSAGGKVLDGKYGPTKGAPPPPKKTEEPKEPAFTPKEHLEAIARAEYPGDELISNQKKLTVIGPARKPYPKGPVVQLVQKLLGIEKGVQPKGDSGQNVKGKGIYDNIIGTYEEKTAKAVRDFQDRHKLNFQGGGSGDSPGIVGPATAEKFIELLNSGNIKGANKINTARMADQGSMADTFFKTLKTYVNLTWKPVRSIFEAIGLADLLSMAAQNTIYLHVECMLEYMSLRQSELNISDAKGKRAMHYVVEACKQDIKKLPKSVRKNGPKHITYEDFYQAQLLDPEITDPEAVKFASKSEGANTINPNIYGQLAYVFGNCVYEDLGSGKYKIKDVYDFNMDANKKSAASVKEGVAVYRPTIENFVQTAGDDLGQIFNALRDKIVGKYGDLPGVSSLPKFDTESGLIRPVEDLLVFEGTALGYSGFEISCVTTPPADSDKA